ncbi:glycosyltransferase family 39 protein [Pseudonocardia sp. TRM90224]|uniref:glycosyltransferase family 39 protein n=1 Tax=Pseudonocardia sp. TRM90224 TaxID=2812678 RepID=UPI001E29DABD|nr:glycosyltransferase family 39 protein [Pseudonocardia sp. TRM90224]
MTADSLTTDVRPRPTAVPTRAAPEGSGVGNRGWWLAIAGCILLAAIVRLVNGPTTSGLGNLYYTATALSMSEDWTAFLTGSMDTSLFSTMDKPPVWLWPSALLIKVFGLSWATLFLPMAVAGIGAVLVLGLAVREALGRGAVGVAASLLAAFGLAVSPVNVAIDRDNYPDSFMVLMLLLAAWMAIRAVRRGRIGPLLAATVFLALAFDAKTVQMLVVVPAFALLWLVAGGGSLGRRIAGLAGAGATLVAACLAWPALVYLLVANPPWVADSPDGTILGRIVGISAGHAGGAEHIDNPIVSAMLSGVAWRGGTPGPGRLFGDALVDQAAWWLPLAVVATVVAALALRGRRRTDPAVGAVVLFAAWLLTCWVVLSFANGVLHPYYTSMLAPALAALAGIGGALGFTAWRRGARYGTAALLALVVSAFSGAGYVLLVTSAQFPTWLPVVVLVTGLGAVAVAVVRNSRAAAAAVGALALVSALAGPVVWTAVTTSQPLISFNPLANQQGREGIAGVPPELAAALAASMYPTADQTKVEFLLRNRGDAKWVLATLSANAAAPFTVATGGAPVMTMGGFNGSDLHPTFDGFREHVRSGEVRFVLAPTPGGLTEVISGPAVDAIKWALQACTPIDPATGGTVAVPAGPPAGPPGFVLLDCATAG